jgi:hypothetical protein
MPAQISNPHKRKINLKNYHLENIHDEDQNKD